MLIGECGGKKWCEKKHKWWIDDLCGTWNLKSEGYLKTADRIINDRANCLVDHYKRRQEAGIPMKIWYPS